MINCGRGVGGTNISATISCLLELQSVKWIFQRFHLELQSVKWISRILLRDVRLGYEEKVILFHITYSMILFFKRRYIINVAFVFIQNTKPVSYLSMQTPQLLYIYCYICYRSASWDMLQWEQSSQTIVSMRAVTGRSKERLSTVTEKEEPKPLPQLLLSIQTKCYSCYWASKSKCHSCYWASKPNITAVTLSLAKIKARFQ